MAALCCDERPSAEQHFLCQPCDESTWDPILISLRALQVVIAIAEKYMRSADPSYPVGRTRLETVGVVACAVIMTIATIEVIQSAAMDLANGFAKGMQCLQYPLLAADRSVSVSITVLERMLNYPHVRHAL